MVYYSPGVQAVRSVTLMRLELAAEAGGWNASGFRMMSRLLYKRTIPITS